MPLPNESRAAQGRALVACLAMMVATSPGQTYVVSAFNRPLALDLGLNSEELGRLYMFGTLGAAALLTPLGRLSDRIGPRRMGAAAALGLLLASLGASQVGGPLQLLAAFVGLRLFGQGALALASSHGLALWFQSGLGRAEAAKNVALAGAVAGAPALAALAIERFGWRVAWPLLASLSALLVVPLSLWWMPERARPAREQSTGRDASLRRALNDPRYWALLATLVASALLVTAVHFHLEDLVGELGLSREQAVVTFTSYAAASLVSTLVIGALASRVDPSLFLTAGLISLAGCQLALRGGVGLGQAHLALGLCGAGHAAIAVGVSPCITDHFGRAAYGTLRGALGTAAVAGASAGPYLFGASSSRGGSFASALGTGALACLLLAPWIAWQLRSRPTRPSDP